MKTAITLLFEEFEALSKASRDAGDTQTAGLIDFLCERKGVAIEKEKEQIQKAFSDGQETPINHPTLPHYSRDEYYNDNYNQNK
jgi:hypothetical protein